MTSRHQPMSQEEITEPLNMRAMEPLPPREALRQRLEQEIEHMLELAKTGKGTADAAEYTEYALLMRDIERRINYWKQLREEFEK